MKVTLDACVLGAMADVEESQRILDIGAGTGLLSLMTAQRSSARIDAVEIDQQAALQAQENFSNSPWAERLNVIHAPVQELPVTSEGYDTIITNPPFFENELKAPETRRNQARHTDTLYFEDLVTSIQKHLSDKGRAWVLLPVSSSRLFLRFVNQAPDLSLERKVALRSSDKHEPHRYILVLKKEELVETTDQLLTIYEECPVYSEGFRRLLKGYYLKL